MAPLMTRRINEIMAHDDKITAAVKAAQDRIFRLAARDHGLTLNAISLESGIPYNTIRSYAAHNGECVVMNVATVNKLRGVIPDYLLSHLLEPTSGIIASAEDCDFDAYALHCVKFVGRHAEATLPESPGGREIVECEQSELKAIKGGRV